MESCATKLTRQNVWRHNAVNDFPPGLRCAALVEASSSISWAILASTSQEPEAEQQTLDLWECTQQFCSIPDILSLPDSASGDLVPERERLGVYLSLTPGQKAALCGAAGSLTEATHVLGALPDFASASQGSRSLRKRVRELEIAFVALRARTDDLEETTGVVLGPGSRNNHAARLRRLEALHDF